jgi:hypothetical protein
MTVNAASAQVRLPQDAAPAATSSKATASDPLAGRTHIFGKPVRTIAVGGLGLAGGATFGGAAFGIARSSGAAGGKLGLITAGAALLGALGGVALSGLTHGPKVGAAYGRNPHFVKTGTEPYNTTCTSTTRVNVGDTDGDGFDNHRSVSTTYPCVKVRDVGYNEWRSATGSTFIGRRVGAAEGYESLEAARKASPDTGNQLLVSRPDGRHYTYRSETSGLRAVDQVTSSTPGVRTR